jgi:selenide,water dikinase
LGPIEHPLLLAGSGGFEDAGIVRIDSERALVQTTDFFPPIVDDPRWFGRIAAANALSDVYAMGGQAISALNLVGWPKELDIELLGEVLAGGYEKLVEAGAALAGGHSVVDHEVKYGLAVTGLVHPDRFWRNSGARVGDHLILTKPLGMGAVSTAIKKERAPADVIERAVAQMATLNKVVADALAGPMSPVHGATDVTGFGLLGHTREMAEGAGLTLTIEATRIPVFDGAMALAEQGLTSGAAKRGRAMLEGLVAVEPSVDERHEALVRIAYDAETSGGLLLAVAESDVERVLRWLVDLGTPCAVDLGVFGERVPGGPFVRVV